jgi:hypothetical protein
VAIPRLANGQYEVKSLKQAKEALLACKELDNSIMELQREHGITEMMEDASELKKAATRWADANDAERIDLGGGRYVGLRRDKYGGTWVADVDDLTESVPSTVVPLRRILKKKFKDAATFKEVWMRVTKRTVDSDALAQEVSAGILTAEEIAPAFFEKEKAAFLRFYGF